MAAIRRISLRRLNLPLVRPYRLSYRTFDTFEPYLVEVEDADGRTAFSDAHISPGSSAETREGGWRFLTERLARMPGADPQEAIAAVLADFAESKVAATAAVTALENLADDPLLGVPQDSVLPLLTPALLAGSVFTCSLSLGDYLAARFVGGPSSQMIGSIIAVMAIGTTSRGSKRAFALPFFNFQPSELGKLLLIHGTADDNVYFFHTLKLSDALFRAGKPHQLLPLSGLTHMVPDPLVTERQYERVIGHFQQTLK